MSNIELVAITQPITKTEDGTRFLTANEFIAYAARISNPTNQLNTETAPKLIKYLAKHKHWSPFQMVSVTLKITTTRDISHQMIRHWSFDDVGGANLQEFSQRYAQATGWAVRECRMQDPKNRQSSLPCEDADIERAWLGIQADVLDLAKRKYKEALDLGIAKEVARAILPEGLTMTTFFMAGTLRAWIHYLQARCAEGVQKEHREIAIECKQIILESFPDLALLFEGE